MASLKVKAVSNYVEDYVELEEVPVKKSYDLFMAFFLIGDSPKLFIPMICKDISMHHTDFKYALIDRAFAIEAPEVNEYYDLRLVRSNISKDEKNANKEASVVIQAAYALNKISSPIEIKAFTSNDIKDKIKSNINKDSVEMKKKNEATETEALSRPSNRRPK